MPEVETRERQRQPAPRRREAPADVRESLERVMGIEPTLSAWEAERLPLNDTRKMPGFRRFYSLTV